MNMFKPTNAKSVEEYLAAIEEPRKTDIAKLHDSIKRLMPDTKPYLVASMIGYGNFHYKYASGKEGDWPVLALASQKNYISVYVCAVDADKKYIAERYRNMLPKANIGKSCIRFKRLSDIDLNILEEIILKARSLTPAL